MNEKVESVEALKAVADGHGLPLEALITCEEPETDGGYLIANEERDALADDDKPRVIGVYRLIRVEQISAKRSVVLRTLS